MTCQRHGREYDQNYKGTRYHVWGNYWCVLGGEGRMVVAWGPYGFLSEGILIPEERKDGGATAVKLPIPVGGRDRNDTDRGEIPRDEGEGDKRLPAGEQGALFHPDAGGR